MNLLTVKPPKTSVATFCELSPTLRAVIYGRGAVALLRGDRILYLTDHEVAKLRAALDDEERSE